MSGQIVGEVIAASDSIRAMGVPRRGFLALIAIADRAHTNTRQASVPWRHIQAVLYGPMPRAAGQVPSTAKRAVADLKDAGLVTVKRGFNNHNGRSAAPLYTIAPLSELVSQVTQSPDTRLGHLTDQLASEPTGHSAEPTGHSADPTGHSDDPLNGSTNGSTNGGSARADPATPDWFDYGDEPPEDQPDPAADAAPDAAGPPTPDEMVAAHKLAADGHPHPDDTFQEPEPSEYCPDHPEGTDGNCGPCGRARKRYPAAHSAWATRKRKFRDKRTTAIEKWIDACTECDSAAWIIDPWDELPAPLRCDHQRLRRAYAAVQAKAAFGLPVRSAS